MSKVFYKGKNLSLSTVRGYASDPDHPEHSKAKAFLERRKERKKTNESFTDVLMQKSEKKFKEELGASAYNDPITIPVTGPARMVKGIAMEFSKNIPNPSTAFSNGYNSLAKPSKENEKKIKENIGQAVKSVFNLNKKENSKATKALYESRVGALEALGEASKALLPETAKFGARVMTGLAFAALSGSGKALAGGAYLLAHGLDASAHLGEPPKNSGKRASTKNDEKFFKQLLSGFAKDDAVAISQFVKDGKFDEKGYKKEMDKALKEIKKKALKYIEELNKKSKKGKSAKRVARRYLQQISSVRHPLL